MQANDAVIVKRAKLRNNIETFCFGIKNDIDEQKYKDCFPELSVCPSFFSFLRTNPPLKPRLDR